MEVAWQRRRRGGGLLRRPGAAAARHRALRPPRTAAANDSARPPPRSCPAIAITQHIGDLVRLAETPPDRFRLILGYAGWGAGQLIEEILRNDWLTAPVNNDLIFAPDPERIWSNALRSVGVDPAALPSFPAAGGGEETTN